MPAEDAGHRGEGEHGGRLQSRRQGRRVHEVMIEGDANGRGFQYPIPTYSITKDFDWFKSEQFRSGVQKEIRSESEKL